MSHDIDEVLRRYTALLRQTGPDLPKPRRVELTLDELRHLLTTLRDLRDYLNEPLDLMRGKSIDEVMDPGLKREIEHAMVVLAGKVAGPPKAD